MKTSLSLPRASTFSTEIDLLIFALIGLTVFFTVAVGICVVFFCIRYRRGSAANRKGATDHHLGIELAWTIPPLLLGLAMFFWNAKVFTHLRRPPVDAMEIFVVGKQWMWHIQHPNGVRENNQLHVPIGKAVKLTMISQDVIHDFFVPAFRMKMDVVPGRYTQQWFEATELGTYDIFCGQYCGTKHSEMTGKVTVMPAAEYEAWLASGGASGRPVAQTLAQKGETQYAELACGNCHKAQSTVRAPSLVGIYGTMRTMNNGRTVKADDPYLRESLMDPYDQLTKGYEKTMPSYKGQLSEEKVLQLNAYIKSLSAIPESGAPGAPGAPGSTAPAAGEAGQPPAVPSAIPSAGPSPAGGQP